MNRSPRTALLLAALLAGTFAIFVAWTGGIDAEVAGVPIRSRAWERPAVIAALLFAAGLYSSRRQVILLALLIGRHAVAIRRLAGLLPVAAAVGAGLVALTAGTFAAGGADSYGYVSQAELFAEGRLTDTLPRSRAFTWPDVSYTLAPLGYKVGQAGRTLAPTYPPGLPMLMAVPAAVHPRGAFLIVPLCAAAAVWFCFVLGRQIGEPVVGRMGALLLATSPTFLYQAVQPMSDVPVTAFWIGALILARRPASWSPIATGAVVSIAILIRPNLAPLAVLVVAAAATASTGVDLRRALTCALGIIPGLLILGAIQNVRYGSAFASGYGSISDMFAWSNVGENLARYPRWLTATHTPFVWLWVLSPISLIRAPAEQRTFGSICYVFVLAVFAAYLPYSYFRPEEWSYTRFLLPAIPVMLVLSTVVILDLARRVAPVYGWWAAVIVILAVSGLSADKSVSVGTFGVRASEQKYPAVGEFVRHRLPESAFVMAMQHSGSIRYYSGRHTLRWDLLDRASLARAVTSLRAAGYTPFAILEREEDDEFHKRFSTASREALDRMVVVGRIGDIQVYAFQ
jgi:Dolichyl-phosphate-mannose-protein mannosyltransferase